MQNYRELIIGLFLAWVVIATYWYVFLHQKLNFVQNSEIVDNNILELLYIIAVSFVLGYFLHKAICASKHLTPTPALPQGKEEVQKSTKDDLKKIEGIGPAIEKLLNKEDVHTYWQLAETPTEKLTEWMTKAGPLYLNHGESTWGEQAALLRDGKMAEFEKLTKELIGGNRVA